MINILNKKWKEETSFKEGELKGIIIIKRQIIEIFYRGEPPEKEEIDDNDYEALDAETMKKREWDEFVEANPRGAGNRGNKG